jgi:hypothetical protein
VEILFLLLRFATFLTTKKVKLGHLKLHTLTSLEKVDEYANQLFETISEVLNPNKSSPKISMTAYDFSDE